MSIYLDYNASAPINMCVLEYMNEIYRNSYGNPDSRTHSYGDNARQVVENAREQVALLAGEKKKKCFLPAGRQREIILLFKAWYTMELKTIKNTLLFLQLSIKLLLNQQKV